MINVVTHYVGFVLTLLLTVALIPLLAYPSEWLQKKLEGKYGQRWWITGIGLVNIAIPIFIVVYLIKG